MAAAASSTRIVARSLLACVACVAIYELAYAAAAATRAAAASGEEGAAEVDGGTLEQPLFLRARTKRNSNVHAQNNAQRPADTRQSAKTLKPKTKQPNTLRANTTTLRATGGPSTKGPATKDEAVSTTSSHTQHFTRTSNGSNAFFEYSSAGGAANTGAGGSNSHVQQVGVAARLEHDSTFSADGNLSAAAAAVPRVTTIDRSERERSANATNSTGFWFWFDQSRIDFENRTGDATGAEPEQNQNETRTAQQIIDSFNASESEASSGAGHEATSPVSIWNGNCNTARVCELNACVRQLLDAGLEFGKRYCVLIVGVVAALLFIVVLLALLCCRRHRKQHQPQEQLQEGTRHRTAQNGASNRSFAVSAPQSPAGPQPLEPATSPSGTSMALAEIIREIRRAETQVMGTVAL